MNDRELLELAAKAADLAGMDGVFPIPTPDGQWRPWNPLEDDGDALRLAVKLRIDIEWSDVDTVWADGFYQILEWHNGDPLAAIRRAIVKAAAALPKESA